MNTPRRLAAIAGFILVWGGLVYGSTQLHSLQLPLEGCSICGPWGCGPPLDALIGAHALWTSLLAPLAGLVCRVLARSAGVHLAKCLLAVGALVIGGLFLLSAFAWFRAHGAEYAIQRGLFVVAITPDVMGLPLLTGGALGLLVARKPVRITDMQEQPVESGAAARENLAV